MTAQRPLALRLAQLRAAKSPAPCCSDPDCMDSAAAKTSRAGTGAIRATEAS